MEDSDTQKSIITYRGAEYRQLNNDIKVNVLYEYKSLYLWVICSFNIDDTILKTTHCEIMLDSKIKLTINNGIVIYGELKPLIKIDF